MSVILEPFNYFIIHGGFFSGVHLSLSRIIQVAVLIVSLFWVIRVRGNVSVTNVLQHNFIRLFFALLIFYFLHHILMILSGGFNVDNVVQTFGMYPLVRSFVDIFSETYKVLYFVILFPVFVFDHNGLLRFFRLFKVMFLLFLFVGFLDYLFVQLGMDLIGRHIYDGRDVGTRFHSFAGEPRHVIPYLSLVLAVSFLARNYSVNIFAKYLYFILALIVVLTASLTGLVALLVASLSVSILHSGMRKWLLLALLGSFIAVYFSYTYNPRIVLYFDQVIALYGQYSTDSVGGLNDMGVLRGQMRDIYPIVDLLSVNGVAGVINMIVGSGPMSSVMLLNEYAGSDFFDLLKPSSYIVSILYDYGFLGLLVIYLVYTYPVKMLASKGHIDSRVCLYVTFCFVVFLLQKSSAFYILIGVVFAVAKINFQYRIHGSTVSDSGVVKYRYSMYER